MGQTEQRHDRPRGVVRDLRNGDPRPRQPHHTRGRNAGATAAAYTVLILLLLPDVANLIPEEWTAIRYDRDNQSVEMPADWVAYLVLTQVSFCGLCLLGAFARRAYATRIALISAGAWYVIQGIDHLVAGNFFQMGHWEYAIQAGGGGR